MPTLRHHYERAFHRFLRDRRIPHVAVEDARRACLPRGAALSLTDTGGDRSDAGTERRLKSFDFMLYGRPPGDRRLIVELKGRRVASRRRAVATAPMLPLGPAEPEPAPAPPRLDPWVTLDDLEALETWTRLFGPNHTAVIVFCFWCAEPFAGALFHDGAGDMLDYRGRWYAIRAITDTAFRARMKTRSPRWRTVCPSQPDFDAASTSLDALLDRSEP